MSLSSPNRIETAAHRLVDLRSLELHYLVAEKLMREPELFVRVGATLTRWRQKVDVHSQPYMMEWEQLVSQGMEACLAIATEDSERAQTLRQCSPFCGVLTNHERFEFYKTWTNNNAAR